MLQYNQAMSNINKVNKVKHNVNNFVVIKQIKKGILY